MSKKIIKFNVTLRGADKKLDSERIAKIFTTKEKEDALKVYEEVKSVTSVIQRLDYPTRRTFYQWLREKNNPVKKIKPPRKRINNNPDHPLHPSPELKLEMLRRCFELGENVRACLKSRKSFL